MTKWQRLRAAAMKRARGRNVSLLVQRILGYLQHRRHQLTDPPTGGHLMSTRLPNYPPKTFVMTSRLPYTNNTTS